MNKYPPTIILRDDDDNFLIAKFQREFKATDKSEPVPEYKMIQFWDYNEEYAVKRELE